MLFKPWPFPLPSGLATQIAELLGSAGLVSGNIFSDTRCRFIVSMLSGSVFWSSNWIRLRDLNSYVTTLHVPVNKGFKVHIEYLEISGRGRPVRGVARAPFNIIKRGAKTLMQISGDVPGVRHAVQSARVRALRRKQPRIPRMREPRVSQDPSGNVLITQNKLRYNGPTLYSSTPWSWYPYIRSKSGTVTPNFGSLKRSSRLPINPYSMNLRETEDAGCYQMVFKPDPNSNSLDIGPYTSFFGGGEFGNPPTGLVSNDYVDNRAVFKLISAAGSSSNGIAQNLAQINQTVNMIALTSNRVAGSLLALRKGNFSRAVNLLTSSRTSNLQSNQSGQKNSRLINGRGYSKFWWRSRNQDPKWFKRLTLSKSKTLAENWLELQYGWKPLLQDLHETMESIAKMNLGNILPQTVRSTAQASKVEVADLHLNTAGNAKTGIVVTHSTWITRYGLRFVIDDHFKSFLAQSGVTNPLSLTWELLPFSFVVDWFLPIGPWLESLHAWDGLSFDSGWKSTLRRKMTFYDCVYGGKLYPLDPLDDTYTTICGNYRDVQISYGRSPLSGFPSPAIPSFKNPLSVDHALNGLALIRSAFHG